MTSKFILCWHLIQWSKKKNEEFHVNHFISCRAIASWTINVALSFKSQNCWVSVELSISCISIVVCPAIVAALPHRVDQIGKEGLGCGSPLLLKPAQQLRSIGSRMIRRPRLLQRCSIGFSRLQSDWLVGLESSDTEAYLGLALIF